MSLSGFSGFSGFSGHSGFSGFSGYSGGRGFSGYSGFSGIDASVVNIPISNVSGLQTALDAKRPYALSIGTGTSLALDFTTNKVQVQEISSNASMTITGLATGETGVVIAYNSHATNTIGITLPTSIGDPSPAYIPAQKYVRFTIFYDGTNYVITYSGVLD